MYTHITKQTQLYGNQSLVNLVNQKGHEKPVKEAYERHMAEVCICGIVCSTEELTFMVDHQLDVPNVKYHYFDFHHECRKMRWDRISALIDILKDDLDKEGYVFDIL